MQYEKAKYLGANEVFLAHFMGSVIVEPKEMLPGSAISRIAIIDGQQRLITFFLLLAAVRDQNALQKGLKVSSANSLSTITPENGDSKPRIVLERSDSQTLEKILSGTFVENVPWRDKDDVLDAYIFFRRQAWEGELSLLGADPIEIPTIARVNRTAGTNILDFWEKPSKNNNPIDPLYVDVVFSQGLKLLEILLDTTDEEASIIFETMNSRRTELLQFDQLRSSIWVALPTKREEFHERYWLPGEKSLANIKKSKNRNNEEQFLYEYLIGSGIGRTTFRSLHKDFMQRAYDQVGYPLTDENAFIKDILLPMSNWANLYPLAVGQSLVATTSHGEMHLNESMHQSLKILNTLGGAPFHPLSLIVLDALSKGLNSQEESQNSIEMLQSFIVRYMLSGEPLSPMRSMTMRMAEIVANRRTGKVDFSKALKDFGWASDAKVLSKVKTVDLYSYGASTIFPILRGIEAGLVKNKGQHPMPFGNKEHEYSIEHVFPQRSETSSVWIEEIAKWSTSLLEMQERTHTLGNFAAVTNYDNKKNARKKLSVKQGLISKCAPLKMNASFLDANDWTPKTIDERTVLLASVALNHWPITK
jgi:hypothetical protein